MSSPTASARAALLVAALLVVQLPHADAVAHAAVPTSVTAPATTFDGLYPTGFTLPPLPTGGVVTRPRPAKSTSLTTPGYTDPITGAQVFRITDTGTDGNVPGVAHIRHEYSRRQVFNADSSRYLAQDANGFWALFDGATFQRVPGRRANGMLAGLAGDAEPIWHPTNPNVLWWWGGGMVWYRKDVRTDTDSVLVDFTGKLPWAGATQVWTKGEGTPSASGRYWGLMATSYDSVAQRVDVHGLLVWDRSTGAVTATLPASAFGGVLPDHVGMSPSGRYVVPSWAFEPALGTRAYTRDFTAFRQLRRGSQHSDLAVGPNGEDLLVYADYDSGSPDEGWVVAVNCRTGAAFRLTPLYYPGGSATAIHLSGKAFARRGWVLASTYADGSEYGATTPADPRRPSYRMVFAIELKRGGRVLAIAHTQTGADYGGYFGEPQASVNADFTRVTWATNFGAGSRVESVMVGLPSTALPPP